MAPAAARSSFMVLVALAFRCSALTLRGAPQSIRVAASPEAARSALIVAGRRGSARRRATIDVNQVREKISMQRSVDGTPPVISNSEMKYQTAYRNT